MSELLAQPAPVSMWVDAEGRTLAVSRVQPGDGAGREVVGTVDGHAYSCDLVTWADVWRDRAPRTPVSKMTLT